MDIPLKPDSLIQGLSPTFAPDACDVEGPGDDTERAGELLWDLSADPDIAACSASILADTILRQLQACAAPSHLPSSQRLMELSCGMLANLFSQPHMLVPQLLTSSSMEVLLELFLSLVDPPTLSEMCRMLTAALGNQEVCKLNKYSYRHLADEPAACHDQRAQWLGASSTLAVVHEPAFCCHQV